MGSDELVHMGLCLAQRQHSLNVRYLPSGPSLPAVSTNECLQVSGRIGNPPSLKSTGKELQFYMLGGYVSKRMGIPDVLMGRKNLGSNGDQRHSGTMGSTAGISLLVSDPTLCWWSLPQIPMSPLFTFKVQGSLQCPCSLPQSTFLAKPPLPCPPGYSTK